MKKKSFLLIQNFSKWINNIHPSYRFLFLLLVLSVLYDYPSILFKRPQSVHHWRQSDCASLSLNYYQTGMHFFQPQTHNLTSDNGTTGYNATSEIPIEYYFIAVLYKIFGYHDFIYRMVNTLIFLAGLFFLYKTLFLWLNSFFWSTTITLFFFTSPVLVYYGNNFLTDTSALAFALVAWYFFSKFYLLGKQKSFFISMFFFLLAGASKITALMSFVSIVTVFLIELFGITKFKEQKKLFQKPVIQAISFFIVILIIGSWALYANNYNNIHRMSYFSTGIFPFWSMDKNGVQQVLFHVKHYWLNQYFHVSALYLLGALFLVSLIFCKKLNRFLLIINLSIFIGTILYIILWFSTFKDHDYYTINLYILLIFTFVSFAWLMKYHFSYLFNSPYIKSLFFAFLLFNVVHANNQIHQRYNGWWNEHPEYKDYDSITPYLRSIGIAPLDTVICLPDQSHFTLYLMNQRGWTNCLSQNTDYASIASNIKKGAKYLIINGNETLSREYLQFFMQHPLGQYGNVRIFKLDSLKQDFRPKQMRIDHIYCGAEKLSENGRFYLADSSTVLLDNGNTRSSEKVFEGKYSVKISKENPYAMTCRFYNVIPGEHFIAEVMRFSEKGNGTLVACTNNNAEFYINSPNRIEKSSNGWDKLILDFYINFSPKDGQIAFYLWNPDITPVYFDNLKIIRE